MIFLLAVIISFFISLSSSFGDTDSEFIGELSKQEISQERRTFIEKSIKNREYFIASKRLAVKVNNGLFEKGKNEILRVKVQKFDIAKFYGNDSQYAAVLLKIEDNGTTYYEITVLIFTQKDDIKQTDSIVIKKHKINALRAYDFLKFPQSLLPHCRDQKQPFPGCQGHCYEEPYIKVTLYKDSENMEKDLCVFFNGSGKSILKRINCNKVEHLVCDK
jgi:hypothetical protein